MITPGCTSDDEHVDIYASIYPVYFITDEIVQDKLVVKQVYPTGADVHEYDPGNGKEMVKMSQAQVMFYVGGGLESFIEKSQNIFSKSDIQLVELSNYLTLCKQTADGYAYLTEAEKGQAEIADMHVWLDPLRMVIMTRIICDKVIEIDPENEQFYRNNANELIKKLTELDMLFQTKLSDPKLEKVILVDHDSYLYWEERYGIKRIRTRADNESCDVSPSVITSSIEQAKKYNIKHIITTENETVCKIIEKYESELNANTVALNHLSTLYKADIENNRDYFTIMTNNLEKLVSALPKKQ